MNTRTLECYKEDRNLLLRHVLNHYDKVYLPSSSLHDLDLDHVEVKEVLKAIESGLPVDLRAAGHALSPTRPVPVPPPRRATVLTPPSKDLPAPPVSPRGVSPSPVPVQPHAAQPDLSPLDAAFELSVPKRKTSKGSPPKNRAQPPTAQSPSPPPPPTSPLVVTTPPTISTPDSQTPYKSLPTPLPPLSSGPTPTSPFLPSPPPPMSTVILPPPPPPPSMMMGPPSPSPFSSPFSPVPFEAGHVSLELPASKDSHKLNLALSGGQISPLQPPSHGPVPNMPKGAIAVPNENPELCHFLPWPLDDENQKVASYETLLLCTKFLTSLTSEEVELVLGTIRADLGFSSRAHTKALCSVFVSHPSLPKVPVVVSPQKFTEELTGNPSSSSSSSQAQTLVQPAAQPAAPAHTHGRSATFLGGKSAQPPPTATPTTPPPPPPPPTPTTATGLTPEILARQQGEWLGRPLYFCCFPEYRLMLLKCKELWEFESNQNEYKAFKERQASALFNSVYWTMATSGVTNWNDAESNNSFSGLTSQVRSVLHQIVQYDESKPLTATPKDLIVDRLDSLLTKIKMILNARGAKDAFTFLYPAGTLLYSPLAGALYVVDDGTGAVELSENEGDVMDLLKSHVWPFLGVTQSLHDASVCLSLLQRAALVDPRYEGDFVAMLARHVGALRQLDSEPEQLCALEVAHRVHSFLSPSLSNYRPRFSLDPSECSPFLSLLSATYHSIGSLAMKREKEKEIAEKGMFSSPFSFAPPPLPPRRKTVTTQSSQEQTAQQDSKFSFFDKFPHGPSPIYQGNAAKPENDPTILFDPIKSSSALLEDCVYNTMKSLFEQCEKSIRDEVFDSCESGATSGQDGAGEHMREATEYQCLVKLGEAIEQEIMTEKQHFGPLFAPHCPQALECAASTLFSLWSISALNFLSLTQNEGLTPDAIQIAEIALKIIEAGERKPALKKVFEEYRPVMSNIGSMWMVEQAQRFSTFAENAIAEDDWEPVTSTVKHSTSIIDIFSMFNQSLPYLFSFAYPGASALVRGFVQNACGIVQKYAMDLAKGAGTADSLIPPPLVFSSDRTRRLQENEKMLSLQRKFNRFKKKLGSEDSGPSGGLVFDDESFRLSTQSIKEVYMRINNIHTCRGMLRTLKASIETKWTEFARKCCEEDVAMDFESVLKGTFVFLKQCLEDAIHYASSKIIFFYFKEQFTDGLYVPSPSSSNRIAPILEAMNPTLGDIVTFVDEEVVDPLVRSVYSMFVLCMERCILDSNTAAAAGGGHGAAHRDFEPQHTAILLQDLTMTENFFYADGSGIPKEEIDKETRSLRQILTQLCERSSDELISGGAHHPAFTSLPDIEGSGTNPWTKTNVFRVLSHRSDKSAKKFIKKLSDS